MTNPFAPCAGKNIPQPYYFEAKGPGNLGPVQLDYYRSYLFDTFFVKPANLHSFGDLALCLDELPDNIKPVMGIYLMRALKHYTNCYNKHLSELKYHGPPPSTVFSSNVHCTFTDGNVTCDCNGKECMRKRQAMQDSDTEITDEETDGDSSTTQSTHGDPLNPPANEEVFGSINANFDLQMKAIAEVNAKTGAANLIDLSSADETAKNWSTNATMATTGQSFRVDTSAEKSTSARLDSSLVDLSVKQSHGVGKDSTTRQSANDSNLAADLPSLLDLKSEVESVQVSNLPAPAVATVESPILKPTIAKSPASSTSERKSPSISIASSKSDSIFSSSEFMSFFSDLKLNPTVATSSPILGSLAASSPTKSEDKIPKTPTPQVPIQTNKNVSMAAPVKPTPREKNKIAKGQVKDPAVLDPKVACILCPTLAHRTESCTEYGKPLDRIFRAQELKRCLICLGVDHTRDSCPQKDTIRCQNCFLPHSSFLYHVDMKQ